MKTKITFAICILVVTFLVINGCKTQEKLSTQPESKPEHPLHQVEQQTSVPWTQGLDENITIGDPINFFNQYKIIVTGKIPIIIKQYKDGKLCFKDSSITFDYSIPQMTKGKFVKVVSKSGKPVSFVVEFTENDKNYDHVFNVEPGKNFTLSPEKKQLNIEGEEYSVGIAIDGDGSGKCNLMYFPEHSNSEVSTGGVATGVPDIIGTKTIKNKTK